MRSKQTLARNHLFLNFIKYRRECTVGFDCPWRANIAMKVDEGTTMSIAVDLPTTTINKLLFVLILCHIKWHGAGMIYSFTEAILCMYFKSWNRLGFRTISFSCTYCVPLLRWHSHHRNILLRDDIPINPCTWSNRYPLKDFILNTYLNQNTQHLIYRNIHM